MTALEVVRARDLDELRAIVGDEGPVVGVGNATQEAALAPFGALDPSTTRVRAPEGVVSHDPAEMTVRCGVATTVAELDEVLSRSGQFVPLDPWPAGDRTVGGVLGTGRSGIRRLRYGAVRDLALEIRFVSAFGRPATAGGPTVKNVSGYDLVRLLVGSLGTLAVMGEVVLRCLPRPPRSRWLRGEVDPFAVRRAAYRPSSILWDGTTTWVLVEGEPAEVDAETRALHARWPDLAVDDGPPPLPVGGRRSLRPGSLRGLTGRFVAEVGVGVVHTAEPWQPAASTPDLHAAVKAHLDPQGRLAPGRSVLP